MQVIIVTGLSGAGKSTALRALEDIGFYCADNIPLPLVSGMLDLLESVGTEQVSISVDARQHLFLERYRSVVTELWESGHRVEVLFLEAPDEILLRRYSETRRRHPMAGEDLSDGIRRDREVLALLREDAAVVNTGRLNVHELKAIIVERYGRKDGALAVTLQSFGFKHGVPVESDLVFDVRFLPNPYFEAELSAKDGREEAVADFVLASAEGRETITRLEEFVRFSLPRFAKEGKLYLTVAVGCTGGRHRSVAVVEELHRRLSDEWDVLVRHRDLNRVV